jgi:nucleotide-binding universal stress UspA family protein
MAVHEWGDTDSYLLNAKQTVEELDPEFAGKVTYNLETAMAPQEYVQSFVKENGIDLVIVGCFGHHSGI